MQGYNIDENKLIVSWNRYEQGLMKAHLMNCANSNDYYRFGDLTEVRQLYGSLVKHGILPNTYGYNNMNIVQLVNDIKSVIQKHLTEYTGKQFPGSQWYYINNEAETFFLTKFAMAIQDTKKRQPFFPGGCTLHTNGQDNPNLHIIYFGKDSKNYITLAKVKLLSLATQLTRIGLNCQTTINWSHRMKEPADWKEIKNQKSVHLIDTNNFLDFAKPIGSKINMNRLGIGMDGVKYYENLYRKLFDFALQKEIKDGEKESAWKIPEFIIPLGSAWGTKLNEYILEALNKVLGENWVRQSQKNVYQGQYRNFISVKIIDTGYWHDRARNKYPNLQHIGIVNFKNQQQLFNDPNKENYMIMAGDHFAFLGNEAMYNGKNGHTIPRSRGGGDAYRDDSLESANMKTDFFRFYGQGYDASTGLLGTPKCGFHQNNGAWIMNPLKLEMPQSYLLHCNYQADKFYQMDGNQQLQHNYNYRPITSVPPQNIKGYHQKGFFYNK